MTSPSRSQLRRGHARLSIRHSLRARLPTLMSALLAAAAATLLWAGVRAVDGTLLRAGGERAASSGAQVAALIERSSQPAIDALRRVAGSPELREYLRNPTDSSNADRARTRLAPLAVGGPRRVDVWTSRGVRVLEIWVPGSSVTPSQLPAATTPPSPGFSEFHAADGVIFIDAAANVAGEPVAVGETKPGPLGTVTVRSTLSINPPGVLSRLVADDAAVLIGNAAGGAWTDLSRIVPPPPVDLAHRGGIEYRRADGQMRLGAVSPVRGTPWAVWVELPRSMILAPARVFLRRMLIVTLVVVVVGALLTLRTTLQITRPLYELARASEDVAGGDYARRVADTRPDEIGQVGRAFNRMVADIRDKHDQLETHAHEQRLALEALRQSEHNRAQSLIREQEARAQAEEANELKDQFLATLSHELRTPLNAILGYARLLRTNDFPAEKHARAVEIIERNAMAQNQLIDDLLDVSRITTGKMRLDISSIPIAVPLREAIDSVRPAAEAKHIALELALDFATGVVKGDPARLQQVFWNLLSNAVKFTPDGGTVRVTVGQDDGKLRTVISDNGAGIPPGFLPRVFDRFRQADGGFSRQHGGLGLGLALCKQLVELHGGTIAAASDGHGLGAAFTVLLPQDEPRFAKSRTRSRSDGAFAASKHPIVTPTLPLHDVDVLVVDDEPDALALVRQILESAGAIVRTVVSGVEALKEFDTHPPDVLVTDLGLPGMDGYGVLRHVRARGPQCGGIVPVIAVTAYARRDDRTKSLGAGFSAHIPKPIDPEMLVSSLVAAVDGQRASGLRT